LKEIAMFIRHSRRLIDVNMYRLTDWE